MAKMIVFKLSREVCLDLRPCINKYIYAYLPLRKQDINGLWAVQHKHTYNNKGTVDKNMLKLSNKKQWMCEAQEIFFF